MDRKLAPKGADEASLDKLDAMRKRLKQFREQEAAVLANSDPAASAAALESVPEDVQSLEIHHAAEFAVRTEQALSELTDEMNVLKVRLAKSQKDQEMVEQDRDRISFAYKSLRDQQKGSEGNSDQGRHLPHGSSQGLDTQSQGFAQGNSSSSGHDGSQGSPIVDPMVELRKEMQKHIALEVQRRVAAIPQPAQTRELPPGHHKRRRHRWTPAEYLTLIGDRVADAEMGFVPGIAGQQIVAKTSLPQMDSSLPPPLIEAGENLREVLPEDFQGPQRTRLLAQVYGGETSSHQKRLAFCFDSRDWKTWNSFHNEFKTLAGREGWTDIQRLNQLRSRLSGQTAATVNRVEYVCGRMSTLEDLCAVCQYHVLGETAVTDSRAQLQARIRKPDENIREYAYALLDLAQIAYPGQTQEHVHKACERFISTVTRSQSIKKMLYQNFIGNPTPSIETLASIAIKAERSEELVNQEIRDGTTSPTDSDISSPFTQNRARHQLNTSKVLSSKSDSKDSTTVSEVSPATVSLTDLISAFKHRSRSRDSSWRKSRRDRSRSRSRSNSRSRNRSGSRNSRDRSRSSSRDRNRHSSSKVNPEDIVCYRCEGKGHYANECPSPYNFRKDRKNEKEDRDGKNKSKKKGDQHFTKRSSSKSRKARKDVMKQMVNCVVAYGNTMVSDSDEEETEIQEK